MANKTSIDPNKSQIKGSRANHARNLNLYTSQLFSRKMRQAFCGFNEHKPKVQKPEWLVLGSKKVSQVSGIVFPEILPQKIA